MEGGKTKTDGRREAARGNQHRSDLVGGVRRKSLALMMRSGVRGALERWNSVNYA
jgi:hypothetical protein